MGRLEKIVRENKMEKENINFQLWQNQLDQEIIAIAKEKLGIEQRRAKWEGEQRKLWAEQKKVERKQNEDCR